MATAIFTLHKVYLPPAKTPIAGPAAIEAAFDFRAAYNATATTLVTVALRNQQASTEYAVCQRMLPELLLGCHSTRAPLARITGAMRASSFARKAMRPSGVVHHGVAPSSW